VLLVLSEEMTIAFKGLITKPSGLIPCSHLNTAASLDLRVHSNQTSATLAVVLSMKLPMLSLRAQRKLLTVASSIINTI